MANIQNDSSLNEAPAPSSESSSLPRSDAASALGTPDDLGPIERVSLAAHLVLIMQRLSSIESRLASNLVTILLLDPPCLSFPGCCLADGRPLVCSSCFCSTLLFAMQ